MSKNFSQKGFTKNFLKLMKQEETNQECCLDFLTQIYTENSSTVVFTGLGTARSPLIAVASFVAPSGITGANDGLTLSGSIVKLGQTVGQAGNPAALTENRQIPMGGHSLAFNNGGSATTLDMLGFANSFRLLSSTYFTIGSNTNFLTIQGNALGSTTNDYPVLQMISGVQGLSTTFCSVIEGFNFSSGTVSEPLLITTSPDSNGSGKAGDIIISPGRIQQTNFSTQVAIKYNVILQPSDGGGVGVGVLSPLAFLHVQGGTASTPPVLLNNGTLTTVPVNGALETDFVNLYFTVGGVRKTVTLT